MENIERQDGNEKGIQGLLEQYLATRSSLKSSIGETSFHLDEDSLAAFADGNLSQRESAPVISHLVACGFCRHKTAALVALDLELATQDEPRTAQELNEPTKISSVLNGVLSKIFGSSDAAVFAHNEAEKDEKPSEEEKKDE